VGVGLPGPMDHAASRVARPCIKPARDWRWKVAVGRLAGSPCWKRRVTLGQRRQTPPPWAKPGVRRPGLRNVLLLTPGYGSGSGLLLGGACSPATMVAPLCEPGLIGPGSGWPSCNRANRGSWSSTASISGLGRLSPLDPSRLCRRADAVWASPWPIWAE